MYTYHYPRPMVTVDIVLLKPGEEVEILLIQRQSDPYRLSWALPGGFNDPDETTEQAAFRELREETGLEPAYLKELCVQSDPKRDPRGRTISVVYYGWIKPDESEPRAGSDAASVRWFRFNELPPLAFDHAGIVSKALHVLTTLNRKDALLIVDLQNDFMEQGALAVNEASQVVPVANSLMPLFDIAIVTRDWHPANHSSFAANHPWRKPGQVIDQDGIEQILWPIHCVQDSFGAAFHKDFDHTKAEQVFYKGTDPKIDSYSAFYDNARQRSTGLADYLRLREVESVYIMGLATDFCVRYSVSDALKEGFEVYVIEDGCRGVNLKAGDDREALEVMQQEGAKTILSSQIKRRIVRQ